MKSTMIRQLGVVALAVGCGALLLGLAYVAHLLAPYSAYSERGQGSLDQPLVEGAVWNGCPFTCEQIDTDRWSMEYFRLWSGAVDRTPVISTSTIYPVRWRIAYGQLWASSSFGFGKRDVHHYWLSSYRLKDLVKGFMRTGRQTDPKQSPMDPDFPFLGGGPLNRMAQIGNIVPEPYLEVHYDYVPVSADAARVFLLKKVHRRRHPNWWADLTVPIGEQPVGPPRPQESYLPPPGYEKQRAVPPGDEQEWVWPEQGKLVLHWEMQVWSYQGKWSSKDDCWELGNWNGLETIAPAFAEPFHVFAQGTNYFFVTDSGKVYISRKPDKGERQMEPLWVDDQRPVHTMITDAATGKVFLFVHANRKINPSAKDFFFELDENRRLQPYDPPPSVDVQAGESLKRVLKYTQVLFAENKIK